MILFSFKMIIVLSICISLIYRFSYLHTYLKKMLEQYLSWVSYHWLVFFHCLLFIYNCLLFFLFKIINYSVQFSHSVVSDSLWPHEPQHARPHGPSPTPGVHPNPCPMSWWHHPLTVTFSLTHRTRTPQPRVFVLAFLPQLFKWLVKVFIRSPLKSHLFWEAFRKYPDENSTPSLIAVWHCIVYSPLLIVSPHFPTLHL